MESISEKIVRLRKEYRYNQKDFAKKIGVSQPSLIKFERGETGIIPIGIAEKIADELFIPFNELFEIEDSGLENEKLKIKINDLNETIKTNNTKINQLLNKVVDKELIIDLLQKEKITHSKQILHFLEETSDMQTYYLNKIEHLTSLQKKEIQNTIINMMHTIASSYFTTTGLITEKDLDKVITKYIGLVRPGNSKEEV